MAGIGKGGSNFKQFLRAKLLWFLWDPDSLDDNFLIATLQLTLSTNPSVSNALSKYLLILSVRTSITRYWGPRISLEKIIFYMR